MAISVYFTRGTGTRHVCGLRDATRRHHHIICITLRRCRKLSRAVARRAQGRAYDGFDARSVAPVFVATLVVSMCLRRLRARRRLSRLPPAVHGQSRTMRLQWLHTPQPCRTTSVIILLIADIRSNLPRFRSCVNTNHLYITIRSGHTRAVFISRSVLQSSFASLLLLSFSALPLSLTITPPHRRYGPG